MTAFEAEYELWDEFRKLWPIERLKKMTLDEYTKTGEKDCFTYWIEHRLSGMGGIGGGAAFKFGVFSRKNTDDKQSNNKLSYSENHGWYTSLGNTAEAAFEKVRDHIVHIATLASQGDINGINKFEDLGNAFKWKVAFHYQKRENPVIVNVFRPEILAAYLGESTQDMAVLQKNTLAKRPANMGLLEYGQQVWNTWSSKNLSIWKLSHGTEDFSDDEHIAYLNNKLCAMYGATSKNQGDNFQTAPVGDLFFLCHGNKNLALIGQFTSNPEPCEKGDGWLQRRYRVLLIRNQTTDIYVTFCIYEKQVKSITYVLHKSAIISSC